MPASSTGAVYANSNAGNKPQATSDDRTQPVVLAGIPNNPTESIDRFLNSNDSNSGNGEIATDYQRPPIEFRQAQTETEAEAQARARMLAQLKAFDQMFASSGNQDS